MHIVYLNPSGQVGGAEACLLDALAVLKDVRPSWKTSAILSEDGPLRQRAEGLGADVRILAFPPELARIGDSGEATITSLVARLFSAAPSTLRYRAQLSHLLSELRPDIIHTNGFKMHVLGALAKTRSAGLIWHIHDYISSRPVMARLMRRLVSRTDAIIANSRHVAGDTREILRQPQNVVPILNVVDLSEFTPEGNQLDLDALSGLPPAPAGTVRVGLLATLAWWKGHRFFLEGLSRVDPAVPIRGYYIGGALYKTQAQESLNELRQYADKLGLKDRVGFPGVVVEPASAMRALDVVVHTSTTPEPFGRVIAEAMACARPIVTTNLGGAAEITALGDFALIVDPQNPDTLASATSKLATDAALRSRMGSNGLSTARAYFGRERLARELPPVYEDVLSRIHGPHLTRANA